MRGECGLKHGSEFQDQAASSRRGEARREANVASSTDLFLEEETDFNDRRGSVLLWAPPTGVDRPAHYAFPPGDGPQDHRVHHTVPPVRGFEFKDQRQDQGSGNGGDKCRLPATKAAKKISTRAGCATADGLLRCSCNLKREPRPLIGDSDDTSPSGRGRLSHKDSGWSFLKD